MTDEDEEDLAEQRAEQAALHRLSSYAVAIKADRIPNWLIDTLLGVPRSS